MTSGAKRRTLAAFMVLPLTAMVLPLAGCGDYGAEYPTLLPAEELLAAPALPAHAQDAAASPLTTQTALQDRHRALSAQAGRAVAQPPQTDGLAARAQALRDRASALRQPQPETPPIPDTPPVPDTS